MPNGKGTYYYNGDTVYYSGNFLDGLKEGEGEMHYIHTGMQDSVIKGYWSGNEYRGITYVAYKTDAFSKFDNVDVIPSGESGNTLTVEIITTSGSPDGTATNSLGSAGYILSILQMISLDGSTMRMLQHSASAFKNSFTYELPNFPCNLEIVFSDGRDITLDLYKSANWRARFFLNN